MLKPPQILGRRLIRRAAQKRREVPHRREVSSLRARRETADIHVLDHASAQRADSFVCHGSAPVLSSWLGNHNLNTGQTQPVNPQTSPPAASNYRVSGLVRLTQKPTFGRRGLIHSVIPVVTLLGL